MAQAQDTPRSPANPPPHAWDRGSPRLPGSGLPPARRAEEAGVKGLRQSVATCPLPLSCSKTCPGGLSGPLGFHSVTLSPSQPLPLSCPGRLSSRSAALSPLSRAFPQEAESEGPGRPGAMTSAWGAGCAGCPEGGRARGLSGQCRGQRAPGLARSPRPQVPPISGNTTCPPPARGRIGWVLAPASLRHACCVFHTRLLERK